LRIKISELDLKNDLKKLIKSNDKMTNKLWDNKKGQFFHYLPLIMLLVLGIFLMFFINTNTKEVIAEKGVATAHFLELFHEVQKRQLQIEFIGKLVATNSIEEYLNGEFEAVFEEECGEIDGVRILIGAEKYCPFTVEEYLKFFKEKYILAFEELYPSEEIIDTYLTMDENKQTVERKLYIKNSRPEYAFSYIEYVEEDQGIVYAVANKKIKYGNEFGDASYSIEPSFDLRLGLSLEEEFSKIFSESISLVSNCANSQVLEDCLDLELVNDFPGWSYGACDNLGYSEKNRVVTFCVESEMDVFDEGEIKNLIYNFGLDFTPLESFLVENIQVSYDSTIVGFDIWFDAQETASSYKIYVTNHALPSFVGSPYNFEFQLQSDELFEYKELYITDLEKECIEPPLSGKGYDCGKQIRFIYPGEELDLTENYYFAVTSLIESKESQINGFEEG
jgi:hypothetical protein